MKIEISDIDAYWYLNMYNSIDSNYVSETDKNIIKLIALKIMDAVENSDHEAIDAGKPTMEELLACETFEEEKINYNPTWGIDPQ
jgi:hypothetical protein